jgi:hypothetical protein
MALDITRHQAIFDPYAFELIHCETTVFGGKGLASYICYFLAKLGLRQISVRAAGRVSTTDRVKGIYKNYHFTQSRAESLREVLQLATGRIFSFTDNENYTQRCNGSVAFVTFGNSEQRVEAVRQIMVASPNVRLIIEISHSDQEGWVKSINTEQTGNYAQWKKWRLANQLATTYPALSAPGAIILAAEAVWKLIAFSANDPNISKFSDFSVNLELYGLAATQRLQQNPINLSIGVAGLGAVGSFLMHILVKMQLQGLISLPDSQLVGMDFDNVEAHNIANQVFEMRQIGLQKQAAMAQLLDHEKIFSANSGVFPAFSICESLMMTEPCSQMGQVLFLAVDSLRTRGVLAQGAARYRPNEFIIECGLGAFGGLVTSFGTKHSTEVQSFMRNRVNKPPSVNGNGCTATISSGPSAAVTAALAVGRLVNFWNVVSSPGNRSGVTNRQLNSEHLKFAKVFFNMNSASIQGTSSWFS